MILDKLRSEEVIVIAPEFDQKYPLDSPARYYIEYHVIGYATFIVMESLG